MRTFLVVAALIALAATGSAQPFGGPMPSLCIPDSLGCGTLGPTVTATVTVPAMGSVLDVDVNLGLRHTWYGDVFCTITHNGVTVTLMDGVPDDSSDLGTSVLPPGGSGCPQAGSAELYMLDDEAAGTFDAAASLAGLSIPAGAYIADNPLSAFDGMNACGDWTVTFGDFCGADIGYCNHFELIFTLGGPVAWMLTTSQPGGAGTDVYIDNVGGLPGHMYLNAMTQVAGGFPFGWLSGVDIPFADLVTEILWGPPFFGPLDPCGESHIIVPGPIPSGVTAYCVGILLSPVGVPIVAAPPFVYMTP